MVNDIDVSGVIVGVTYKYKELCDILMDKPCTGRQKMLQLKRWSGCMSWENPTTHRYKITEVYDKPVVLSRGGKRSNSGRKKKLYDEFLWLLNSFMHREFNRNTSGGHDGRLCSCRFTGNEISKYFGLYNDNFHNAVAEYSKNHDDGVDEFSKAWSEVSKLIAEMRRRWIYDRISSLEGVKFGYGVIAYKDKDRSEFDYLDDKLGDWNSYMARYMERHKLKNEGMVADRGMYLDMIKNISLNFDDYVSVERVRRFDYDIDILKEYEFEEYEDYRRKFNDAVVDGIKRHFDKKVRLGGYENAYGGFVKVVVEEYVML